MKKIKKLAAVLCVAAMLTGCGQGKGTVNSTAGSSASGSKTYDGATVITLSDKGIKVDGEAISEDDTQAVYAAKDIVFYLEGQSFTYGEGTEEDAHSQAEADAHTVVHITEPGSYVLSGKLSKGQIAVDLGEDAEEDPEAVVTLILNGVDITCSVAPAVIFYNVYECGSDDAETASKDVDTSNAGANVLIADDSVNNVSGSYVARIYKSYELNETGTAVVDSKKLHKYDAAFYSKKSMNVNGDEEGSGILNIVAENEGLDSELYLTINGGNINITSGNDGINTNEDGVSVTTVNGGTLNIKVDGKTGEGDGIDSNGWLVINGGTVIAEACSFSADAGIDSDMGIHINGGNVIATGNMLDRFSESTQNYAVFAFASTQKGGQTYSLKNEAGEVVFEYIPENDFTYLAVSSEQLTAGSYTFWSGKNQLAGSTSRMMGGFGGMMGMPGGFGGMQLPEGFEGQLPEGFEGQMPGFNFEDAEKMDPGMVMPQMPEGMTPPEGMEIPNGGGRGQGGQGGTRPEGFNGQMPEGFNGQRPEGFEGFGGFGGMADGEVTKQFVIADGGNYFSNVTKAEQ